MTPGAELPGKMAKQYDFKWPSLDQMNEVVNVRLGHGCRPEIVKFFRYLTLKYAPGFAVIFADPPVTAITLKVVPLMEMRYFTKWLHSSYEADYKHDKDLWQACGATPDWSLVDCNCTKPDKYDYREEYGREDDPLYPPQECSEGAWEGAKACVGLFTFGSAYGITPLREDALDRLCWYYNEVRTIGLAEIEDPAVGDDNWELTDPILPLPAKHCEHAYNQTPPGSPLRKLLVRAFCASHQPGHRGKFICVGFKTCCDFSTVYLHKDILQPVDPPQELLADVAACFASGVSSTYVVKGEDIACEKYPVLPPSDFHAHNSEQERQHCSKLPVDPNTRVHIEE